MTMRLFIILGLCLQFTSTALADESQKEIDKVYRTTKLSKAGDENLTLLKGPERSSKGGMGALIGNYAASYTLTNQQNTSFIFSS